MIDQRPTIGNEPVRDPRQDAIASPTPMAQARRGALLQAFKEGSPVSMQILLSELEIQGHVAPDEDIIADEVQEEDLDSELDSEVSLADEDREYGDEEDQPLDTFGLDHISLDGEMLRESQAAERFSAFEIVIDRDRCSFIMPDWGFLKGKSPDGDMMMYEVDTRFLTLTAIAAWLSVNRGEFLQKRDLWYLGCSGLVEAGKNLVPTLQKDLLSELQIKHLHKRNVSRSSFSRYIRHTRLVWEDGSTPLSILFSKEAKLAWAAHTIVLFSNEYGEKLTSRDIELYADTTAPRLSSARKLLLKGPLDSFDLPTAIQRVCALAEVSWREVVATYGGRMIGS